MTGLVRPGVVLAMLLVSLALPSLDTVAGWDATSYSGWPGVGLSAACFVLAGARGRTRALAVQTVSIGLVLSWTYDVVWWEGLAGSFAVTVPAMLSAHWLRPGLAPYQRFNDDEVDAYHGVTAVAGAICGLLSATAAAGAQRGNLAEVALVGVIAFFGATTSLLLILPFVLRAKGGWTRYDHSLETWAQRAALLAATGSIFAWHSALPVAFVIFPVIGWAAIRATAPETHVQVLLVSVAAFAATLAGRGPLALGSLEEPNRFAPLLVYMFIACLLYLIVPLALTVERLTSVTRQATASARTVNRMLDSATGTVFIATDTHSRITHFNPGAEQALGFTAAEVLGQSTFRFHTAEETQRQAELMGVTASSPTRLYAAVVTAQVDSGTPHDWEFQRKDGVSRTVSLNISTMTEATGAVVGYIVSGEDITERARAQEATQRALVRERESVQTLEKAVERERESVRALLEADSVKQELISTVSHELRTPVTNISGYAEVLIDGDLGELAEQQLDAVDRIERNAARLRELVDDLLMLSRLEAGAISSDMDHVDLNEVARAAAELLTRHVSGRRLATRVELAPAAALVRGDRRLLERVVSNLWSNAIKFTPDGGSISMIVRAADPSDGDAAQATICVRDNGMGVAAEEQSRIFDRFYRTSAAGERAIQGSGLGLSIVRAIVDQHDGSISLTSSVGEGSSFTVSLPGPDRAAAKTEASFSGPTSKETQLQRSA